VARGEDVAEARQHRVEGHVVHRQVLGLADQQLDLQILLVGGRAGHGEPGVDLVDAHHGGARAGRAQRDGTRAGGDIEDAVAGADPCIRHQALGGTDDVRRDRRVVTGRPHGARLRPAPFQLVCVHDAGR
jgi:hypothetical protein